VGGSKRRFSPVRDHTYIQKGRDLTQKKVDSNGRASNPGKRFVFSQVRRTNDNVDQRKFGGNGGGRFTKGV